MIGRHKLKRSELFIVMIAFLIVTCFCFVWFSLNEVKFIGLMIILFVVPSLLSFILKKHALLSFFPALVLASLFCYYVVFAPNPEPMFFPSPGKALVILLILCAVGLNLVITIVIYFINRVLLHDNRERISNEAYDLVNSQWECPSCNFSNPNIESVCSKCGYKVL